MMANPRYHRRLIAMETSAGFETLGYISLFGSNRGKLNFNSKSSVLVDKKKKVQGNHLSAGTSS